MIEFTPWPEEAASDYRRKEYWIDQPLNHLLEAKLNRFANNTAIICQHRHISYAQLDNLSTKLAQCLADEGLKSGDTALVQLPNCAEFYIVFFALLKCGVVPVFALFNHNLHELIAFSKQISPDLVILSESHQLFEHNESQTEAIIEVGKLMPNADRILLLPEPFGELTADLLPPFHWRDGRSLAAVNSEHADFVSTPADQVAFFQLSGGSTGTPKLIPRTHNDYYYSVRLSAQICMLTEQTVFLCSLPAAHNFTLSSPGALGVFYTGGTVVTATDPSPATCFPLIEKHKVTISSLVPPALSLWLSAAGTRDDNISSLSVIQVGGAKLSPAVAAKVSDVLSCQLQQVFGMAEGLVNYTRYSDSQWHIENTQGFPMSSDDEVRVLNEQGEQVSNGEVGELWTRGPYTFRGYYRSPIANSRAFDSEGFYCTGDLVRHTNSGHLIVVGRNKDQINRGGEKIDAQEVEDVLLAHENILQVALVAMPDELLGEKSCAFIIAKERLKAVEIRRFLRSQGIADFKLPDVCKFVDNLPKTAVGKIDKKTLRELVSCVNS